MKTALAEIDKALIAATPYEGQGKQYAGDFVVEVSNEVSDQELWKIKIDEENVRFLISEAAIKNGISLERWVLMYSHIFTAYSWMPIRLINQKEILLRPSSTLVEKQALEASFLNLVKVRFADHRDNNWDIAKALIDPEDRFAEDYIIKSAFFKSIAPVLGEDLNILGMDGKAATERVSVVAKKFAPVINGMLEPRVKLIEQYTASQNVISKYKLSSATVNQMTELVSKNDRAGVAKILEASLPWDLFTASETSLYQDMIQAIRFPDASKMIYLLRGTNPTLDPTPETLGLEPKLFKLPRFEEMSVNEAFAGVRNEWGYTAVNRQDDIPFPSFFNFGENHSQSSSKKDGYPSVMISTSASGPVVSKFAKGSKVMIKIDSRRVYPNYESMMYHEREVLIPLFVFPDEIAGVLQKDPVTKKNVVVRPMDQSVNTEATEFYLKNMAREAVAQNYIREIWKVGYENLFPKTLKKSTASGTNSCLSVY
jgi:hypothetical protein